MVRLQGIDGASINADRTPVAKWALVFGWWGGCVCFQQSVGSDGGKTQPGAIVRMQDYGTFTSLSQSGANGFIL